MSGVGLEMGLTHYSSLLADLEFEAAGRHDAALETLEGAIRWGRSSGEAYMIAELLRLKGVCLRARGPLARPRPAYGKPSTSRVNSARRCTS